MTKGRKYWENLIGVRDGVQVSCLQILDKNMNKDKGIKNGCRDFMVSETKVNV